MDDVQTDLQQMLTVIKRILDLHRNDSKTLKRLKKLARCCVKHQCTVNIWRVKVTKCCWIVNLVKRIIWSVFDSWNHILQMKFCVGLEQKPVLNIISKQSPKWSKMLLQRSVWNCLWVSASAPRWTSGFVPPKN